MPGLPASVLTAPGVLVSVVLASGVAVLARRLRALTTDGAVAATVVGGAVLAFGGWRAAGLLVLFFVSSSALTAYRRERKPHPEHRRGRSAAQVLANGAVPAALAVAHGTLDLPWALGALGGALAASTADTWATEVGLLSPSPPRLITTGAVVEPGRSGGVTVLGTAAGAAGAGMVAAAAAPLVGAPAIAVGAAGIVGLFLDSLLGAVVEGRPVGRRALVTNDVVNLATSLAGAGAAALLGGWR